MTNIFEATKAEKPRTTVIGKATSRGVAIDSNSFPAIVEPAIDGKTLLLVVVKGKLQGVFNRLGQKYPMKDKECKQGTAFAPIVTKDFTPKEDGVYVAQLSAEGLNRTKVKSIISMTRGSKLTGPEQTAINEKFVLNFTDYYTLEEFNTNKFPEFNDRKESLISALSSIKLKKTPNLSVVSTEFCESYSQFVDMLKKFDGVFLRPVSKNSKASESTKLVDSKETAKCEKPSKNESKTEKPKKSKKSKKDKKAGKKK